MKVGATDETFSREYDIISTLAVVLMEGDHVILYSQERINHANLITI